MNTTADFKTGDRVQAHPATDLFMRGVRYGTVLGTWRGMVRVQWDKLEKPVRMMPGNVLHLEG